MSLARGPAGDGQGRFATRGSGWDPALEPSERKGAGEDRRKAPREKVEPVSSGLRIVILARRLQGLYRRLTRLPDELRPLTSAVGVSLAGAERA